MDKLSDLASRQHGVVRRSEIIAAGFSTSRLERMVAQGVLKRVGYQTYVFAGVPPTWEQAVAVAVTSAGPNAAASHQTAAFAHGLTDRRPHVVEVVTPRWRRSRAVDFVVHESLDLLGDDVIEHQGMRVTTPVRTVVDLGASAHSWLVESVLDTGIRQRAFTLEDVARFVGRVAKRGRRGVGVIRPLIEQRILWDGLTESELEDLLRRAWGDRRPQLVPQFIIRTAEGKFICRSDFAFPELKVRIELDSEAFHMDRPTFRRDRAVQNETELLGWRTLRYTWWDLTTRPLGVVRQIEIALRKAAA